MTFAQIQFAPWDKLYDFSCNDLKLSIGDYVIVETEFGLELGKIANLVSEGGVDQSVGLKPVLRLAVTEDIEVVNNEQEKKEILDFCQEKIIEHQLPMKLVDVHKSYSSKRLNFAFIAEGRVDFRDLVKDLTTHFESNIRLTQIGTRDEARLSGDCGPCGRGLCCREFLDDFSSITSEMAEAQQVVHRGSERISGMCSRLMCCLSFEYEGYQSLGKELPPIGTKVNVNGQRGTVIGHHVLKQTVDVKIQTENGERGIVVEVDPKKHQKSKRK